MSTSQKISQKDSINYMTFIKLIWERKWFIVKVTMIFVFLGLFVALFSTKKYTASSIFVAQTGDSGGGAGNFGGLAALAGIDVSGIGSNSQIPPNLYPKIAKSIKFKSDLINSIVHPPGFPEGMTYARYYEKHAKSSPVSIVSKYTVGLPSKISVGISSLFGKKSKQSDMGTEETTSIHGIRIITAKEKGHFKRLDAQLSVLPSKREGHITLSFIMEDPVMAAEMAQYAKSLLQREVIGYKIKNAEQQLLFLEKRYSERKREFEGIKKRLANFRDRNQNITSAIALNKQQDLESEFDLAFEVFIQLAKQLEQAKLQVTKDTPIFTVIQAVSVPIEKTSPKRFQVLFSYTLFGGIVAILLVFWSRFSLSIKEFWHKS